MKKKTKFNKLFPNAENIKLSSNGVVWGVWFNIKGELIQRFYAIENQLEDYVIYQTEILKTKTLSNTPEKISKICLN